MALIEKLNAIGDAIRGKTYKEDKLTLEQMATEIEGIEVGGNTDMEDGLISGTVTDYTNDRVTELRPNAFYTLPSLKTVNLPNVKSVGSYAFYRCTNLQSASLPNADTLTAASGGAKGSSMFSSCSSLESAYFPALKEMAERMFDQCTSLKIVNLSSAESVNAASFNSCTALKDIYLPNVKTIYSNGFSKCSALERAVFDKSVGFIRQTIFNDCSSLIALVLRGETLSTLSYTNVFTGTPIESGTGYIYVPRALLSDEDATMDYRRATNWIAFAEQFRAIEDYPEICGGAEND